jgi:hypothetical protein
MKLSVLDQPTSFRMGNLQPGPYSPDSLGRTATIGVAHLTQCDAHCDIAVELGVIRGE